MVLFFKRKMHEIRNQCILLLHTPLGSPLLLHTKVPLIFYFPRDPEGFYFQYPGFPSLMVPYGRASDFFFSGHCGILTLTACEWYYLKKFKLFYPNLFALIFTAFALLAVRVHYLQLYFYEFFTRFLIKISIFLKIFSFFFNFFIFFKFYKKLKINSNRYKCWDNNIALDPLDVHLT